MRTFAPYVGGREHNVGWQFPLHVEIPLLYVRPYRLVGYGNDRKRKERYLSTTSADTCIAAIRACGTSIKPNRDIGLRRGKHEWRGGLPGFVVWVCVRGGGV